MAGQVWLMQADAVLLPPPLCHFSTIPLPPPLCNRCLPACLPLCVQVQMDNPPYSRGIRQRLANASLEGDWFEKYKIVVGE